MSLPLPPLRRATLRAFWIAVCLELGILVGLAALLPIPPAGLIAGLAAVAALLAAGCLSPEQVAPAYRFWNRGASRFAVAAARWIAGICYYTVFAAAALSGSPVLRRWPRQPASNWSRRDRLPEAAYGSTWRLQSGMSAAGSLRPFVSWALKSGNSWAVVLVPFLLLLRALDSQPPQHVPSDLYTLY